ncbi:MAG: hypothetical protein WCW26_05635 [Candidatus Buchananbacteria bacterium]
MNGIALLIRNAVQAAEMHTALNIQGAREEFHIPGDQEVPKHLLLIHYAKGCERAAQMGDVHSDLNVFATGEEICCDPTTLTPSEMEAALWSHYQKYHPEVPFDRSLLPRMAEIVEEALQAKSEDSTI